MICPKCRFQQDDHNTECLKCGLIFKKYFQRQSAQKKEEIQEKQEIKPSAKLELAKEILFYIPERVNPFSFWGRCALLLALIIWSANLAFSSIDDYTMCGSFAHMVNLPFHEAGHIVFRPFGRIIHSLGGTLGQLLMPLICLFTFLIKTRDSFGAAVTLWWFGENYIDIAPYIDDARSLSMPLLGGNTGMTSPYGFHDWQFILTELNLLKFDHFFAKLSYIFGVFIMILACIWGSYILLKQYKKQTIERLWQ